MAKQYYDQKIDKNTDWGGDRSTGGLQVKGNRVQEFIKGEFDRIDEAITVASEASVRAIVSGYQPETPEVEPQEEEVEPQNEPENDEENVES